MSEKPTARLGIKIADHAFDRGYWARFDGAARKDITERGGEEGWDACDEELRAEQEQDDDC